MISLPQLILLMFHASGNISAYLDDPSASLIALFCLGLVWFTDNSFFFLLSYPSLNVDSFQGSTDNIPSYLFQLSTSALMFMLYVSQIVRPYFCSLFQSWVCNCCLNIFTWIFYTKPICQKLPYPLPSPPSSALFSDGNDPFGHLD